MSLEDPSKSQARLRLRIFCPMQPLKMVSVRRDSQISSLHKLWASSRRFVFHGMELDDLMTFESYGLQDGDSLVAISPSESGSSEATPWITVTRGVEGSNESLRWRLDFRTAREFARLRDLAFTRSHWNPKAFPKFSRSLREPPHSAVLQAPLQLDYPPAIAPSATLPASWELK
jgi:hypothetical protein